MPRKWLTTASKLGAASTSMRPAQAASPPWSAGQIRPRSCAEADIAAGSTPVTALTPPSSDSSPSAA